MTQVMNAHLSQTSQVQPRIVTCVRCQHAARSVGGLWSNPESTTSQELVNATNLGYNFGGEGGLIAIPGVRVKTRRTLTAESQAALAVPRQPYSPLPIFGGLVRKVASQARNKSQAWNKAVWAWMGYYICLNCDYAYKLDGSGMRGPVAAVRSELFKDFRAIGTLRTTLAVEGIAVGLIAALVGASLVVGKLTAPPVITSPYTAYVINNTVGGGSASITAVNLTTRASRAIAPLDALGPIAITPDGKTLYIAALGGCVICAELVRIDLLNGNVSAGVAVADGLKAIAIAPDGKTVYAVTNRYNSMTRLAGGSVVAIDIATNTVIKSIDVAAKDTDYVNSGLADIAITPNGKTAYVVNQLDGTLTPVDLARGKAGPAITIGGSQAIKIAPDGNTAYVISGSLDQLGTFTPNGVVPIDLATRSLEKLIPMDGVAALAITADGKTLYMLGTSGLIGMSLTTKTFGKEIAISGSAMAITPDAKVAYVATSNGLTPVDLASGALGASIDLDGGVTSIVIST